MDTVYDNHYQSTDYFGKPLPELIEYFTTQKAKGKLLDVGCGQGRNLIPLAVDGFETTGIDISQVGLTQIKEIAKERNLSIEVLLVDQFEFKGYGIFDYILLDSMFHFSKPDRAKEEEFITRILKEAKSGCKIIFSIQDIGKKVKILKSIIDGSNVSKIETEKKATYIFEDKTSDHVSHSPYRIVVVEKR